MGLIAWLAVGCLDSSVVTCEDGRVCAGETVCDETHDGCVLEEQLETCEDRAEGAACRYRGVPSGACREGVCLPSGCGNGVLEAQEVCDDGNRIHGDGCSGDCRSDETCGNGVVDITVGESCERVSERDSASCRPDCVSMRCGDGVLDRDAHEVCDEGAANSLQPAAACRPNCQPRRCGDGVRDPDEICDDGNTRGADGCSAECDSDERCGNGVVDTAVGESCEPTGPTDRWCRSTCDVVRCGDGIPDEDAFEACDEGAANSDLPNAICRPNCQPRRCGDGVRDDGELCDDGNLANGDGCSHDCKSRETCGNGYRDLDEGEECDDNNLLSHDGCSSNFRTEAPRRANIGKPAVFPSAGSLAYDAGRGRFVYFGADGLGNAGVAELDEARWRAVPMEGARPTAQTRHALVWNGKGGGVLLFGGQQHESRTPLNETWTWNGAAWTQLTPRTTAPPGRTDPALVYDAGRERVVMVGGARGETELSDTWEWDGEDWKLVPVAQPPTAGSHPATYDPTRGKVVLFDGIDLWSYGGERWDREAVDFSEPFLAHGFDLAFDAARGSLLLVEDDGVTWVKEGETWRRFATAGDHELSPPVLQYSPVHRTVFLFDLDGFVYRLGDSEWELGNAGFFAPPRLSWQSLTYEPLSGTTLLFGGTDEWDATWSWDGFGWHSRRPPAGSPGVRNGHSVSHDGRRGRIVVFGGNDGESFPSSTWAWDPSGWHELSSDVAPPVRRFHAMGYDGVGDRILLHGGQPPAGRDAPVDFGDVWSFRDGTWSQLHGEPAPPNDYFHAMAYDGVRARLALFNYDHPPLWEWTGTTWQAALVDGPAGRAFHGLAFNAQRGRMMLYGGYYFGSVAWEWNGKWEPVPDVPGAPHVQSQNIFTYDAARARILALGTSTQTEMYEFAYLAPGEPEEACRFGFDTDGDGKVGCDDPDCWPFCAPLCPPGSTCDASLPHCGDGTCNEHLETCRMCPEDCSCDAVCGDFFCDAGETAADCPGDCH